MKFGVYGIVSVVYMVYEAYFQYFSVVLSTKIRKISIFQCGFLDNVSDFGVILQRINQHKNKLVMSKEQEDEVLRFMQDKDLVKVLSVLLKGLDVSEIVNLVILSGRGYSVKLLKFFKWYCQIMPIFIMVFHIACMYVFAQHSKEMCIWYKENMLCYSLIYFAVYIHPMIIIPASRFFWLCYRYRIPLFAYFLGVNSVHIVYGNIFTTNEMIKPTLCMVVFTILFYGYGLVDKWLCGDGKQSMISMIQK